MKSKTDYMRRWRAENPGYARRASLRWYHKHKTEVLQQIKATRFENPEIERARDRERYPRRKAKLRIYLCEWRKKNQAKIKEAGKSRYLSLKGTEKYKQQARLRIRAFRLRHPERVRVWSSSWRSRNKNYQREWLRRNPEKSKRKNTLRHLRAAKAKGFCVWKQWMQRVTFYGWRCFYCQENLSLKTLTQDHRIPLSRGGTNWASNLVPACLSCNDRKHTKLPAELTASYSFAVGAD